MSSVPPSTVEQEGWELHAIGRRRGGDVAYMLPRHASEIDRLDVQHYALRAALHGNYVAPVGRPRRILDVGSGTGQWGHDLCEEFPEAQVVGFDLVPGKAGGPRNYRLVRGNLLHGLPFADGRFAFVHQRLMMTAVPAARWPRVVGDIVRVTEPGGVVELVEIGDRMEPRGPATGRLLELAGRLGAAHGLDDAGVVLRSLDGYLRDAGCTAVERHSVAIPLGAWGGEIGIMMATDFQQLFLRLCEVFEARGDLPPGEGDELLAAAAQECEVYHSNAVCTFVHGRAPRSGSDP